MRHFDRWRSRTDSAETLPGELLKSRGKCTQLCANGGTSLRYRRPDLRGLSGARCSDRSPAFGTHSAKNWAETAAYDSQREGLSGAPRGPGDSGSATPEPVRGPPRFIRWGRWLTQK